jgi:hypothetical protein
VVRAREQEFGIEIQAADNFWGLVFPPDIYQEQQVKKAAPASQELDPFAAPAYFAPEPTAKPMHVPAQGILATVSGVSVAHARFLEHARMVRRGESTTEAILWLKNTVDMGALLRVSLPESPTFSVRVARRGAVVRSRTMVAVALLNGAQLAAAVPSL